jgi:DNA-directed RNA polymerase subunit F
MEIKSSKPVTLSEVKEILGKRNEESELGYEQSQALEHAEKFCKCDTKKAQKLLQSLAKNDKITDDIAAKIVDVMPNDPATLRAILAKDKIEMSDEELEALVKELS